MCLFSKSLRPGQFRNAKVNEDLVIDTDAYGHTFSRSPADGLITCIRDGGEVQIAKLMVAPQHERSFRQAFPSLVKLIGQPVTARFREGVHHNRTGRMSSDMLWIEGHNLALVYLAKGTAFYLGPKRMTLEAKLGVDDPSIALDHRETVVDETPTATRAFARALGLCSIIR